MGLSRGFHPFNALCLGTCPTPGFDVLEPELKPFVEPIVTCDMYKDLLDVNFCADKENGNYPVNDDKCSLFYNCWAGETFCESCDERGGVPYFIFNGEGEWGTCTGKKELVTCPTPGYPVNRLNPTEEPIIPEPTEQPGYITCNQYAELLDRNFCEERENGNYPVNDDNCSLFYNCWNGETSCESCDARQAGTPYFIYREGDWGICSTADALPISWSCPTEGFPINHLA